LLASGALQSTRATLSAKRFTLLQAARCLRAFDQGIYAQKFPQKFFFFSGRF
jgi:hypothetical protein